MIGFDDRGRLFEAQYEMTAEPQNASLFTTGNGYMGIRGSFEEFGTCRVQGAYIRGLLDQIIEIVEPFSDNEYMRNYYFDEEKLKGFDEQESCINFADFLLIRFSVGKAEFYPWTGKIVSWKRYLDFSSETLVRKVRWDDGSGNLTDFIFERFASYDDEHLYCQRATAKAVNHNLPIKAFAGIDAKVRTCGQKIVKNGRFTFENNAVIYDAVSGKKFGFGVATGAVVHIFDSSNALLNLQNFEKNESAGFVAESTSYVCVEKYIVSAIDRDFKDIDYLDFVRKSLEIYSKGNYGEFYKRHLKKWRKYFSCFDVKIEGDKEADFALRYSNYHTAISAALNDSIHGLSAKGLTGEKYNQFVWWDCEIYQLPIFVFTYPEAAKQALLYRYRLLEQAKKNAAADGKKGAKFAFCSGVTGEELVWIYARHPFMQIHINADIAFCLINYYTVTGDEAFLRDYGMEMLIEIAKFWLSSVVLKDGRYEILCVTGTDEHHPYVDNDAYTNYIVRYILKKTLGYIDKWGWEDKLSGGLTDEMRMVAEKLYLPVEEFGMIPQFDGYFKLSRALQIKGNGTGKGFQMKHSGLYHLSQIIKQPDVILLYTLADVGLDKEAYARNWDYYEKMCESSSSLSACVHAIASIDNDRPLSFYNYFMQTSRMDIDDLYGTAWQGIHSGCAAGAYLCVLRGVLGIRLREDAIYAEPAKMPFWEKIEMNFIYKGIRIFAEYTHDRLILRTKKKAGVRIYFREREYCLDRRLVLNVNRSEISGESQTTKEFSKK